MPAKRPRMHATLQRELRGGLLAVAVMLAGATVLSPDPARAWGDEGHRIIALIAYAHLTPTARTPGLTSIATATCPSSATG